MDGGSGTVILYLSPTGTNLRIGSVDYGYKVNSLDIENRIGERGTARFSIQDQQTFSKSNTGSFVRTWSNPYHTASECHISTTTVPKIGTRIVFTGTIPLNYSLGTTYYVVDTAADWFKVSATSGGAALDWTAWPGHTGSGSFTSAWTETGGFSFSIGETVDLYIDGEIIWSGVIERINKQLPGGSTSILYTFNCVSWNYACDKRRIVAAYSTDVTANLCAGNIVQDILDTYLKNEGITAGSISTGAALGNVVFNYVKPSACFDTLAEHSGYIWQVNPDKTLDFKPHDHDTIAFNIGSTQILYNQIQFTETNPKYRNTQYVVGGVHLTDLTSETQYGDSTKQTFTLPYYVMATPAVYTFDGVTSSTHDVGILGVDTTFQWFWNKFSNIISQNASDTPLTSTEALQVVYTGGYKDINVSRSMPSITSLKSVEGGSGVVEDVLNAGENTYYTDNQVMGDALISKYSTITNTLTFKTRVTGITPGKILKVSFPEFSLSSEEMLVDSVSIKDDDGQYWYSVSALTGPEHGGWSKFFDDFITKTVEKDISENVSGDFVVFTTDYSEPIVWVEDSTEVPDTCPLCSSSDESEATTGLYPTSSNENANAGYPC